MNLLPQNSSDKTIVNSGSAFAISENNGNILEGTTDGFYFADTRFVSKLRLLIDGTEPGAVGTGSYGYQISSFYSALKSSSGGFDNTMSVVRDRVVDGGLHEDIYIQNHTTNSKKLKLEVELDCDFADIFEVRRNQFSKQGHISSQSRSNSDVFAFVYDATNFHCETLFKFSKKPKFLGKSATFEVEVGPHGTWKICAEVALVGKGRESIKARCVDSFLLPPFNPRRALKDTKSRKRMISGPFDERLPTLQSDNPDIKELYSRALYDLRALQLEVLPRKFILAAGMPWFMTLFGRDSIIAAMQTKVLGQELMINTLQTLANFQETEFDDFRESQPGKIPHEIRHGELSVGEKIPHSRYYGTIDATPLFLMLVYETYLWTGNARLIERFAPAIDSALNWIDNSGDLDGDGFVEYQQKNPDGLINQGWKDSDDSISFSRGGLAEPPIALAEVQGYVYAAKLGIAKLCKIIGIEKRADELIREAKKLKEKFNRAFWMEKEGFFAIALDGGKNQVDSISSNPGHCLWCGIVDDEKSAKVVRRLTESDMFSGWGIRTLSSRMARFDPISYHNGSVWPHDNSIIAAGMARYGFVKEANMVLLSNLEAAAAFPHKRPPELFAGYSRRELNTPIPYPGANSPQAWASGAVIYAIETLLGVTPQGNHLFLEARPSGPSIMMKGVPFRGTRRYL